MHPQPPDPQRPDREASLDALDVAEMERALAALPLREPSPSLDARVAAALAGAVSPAEEARPASDTIPFPGPTPGRSRWLTGLAIAAALALLATVGLTAYFQATGGSSPHTPGIAERQPDPAQPGPHTEPGTDPPEVVEAGYNFHQKPVDLHWTRDLDAGTLKSDHAQPVRAVRRQDVQQRVWVDPERGVTVQVTRPRERLVLVQQPTF